MLKPAKDDAKKKKRDALFNNLKILWSWGQLFSSTPGSFGEIAWGENMNLFATSLGSVVSFDMTGPLLGFSSCSLIIPVLDSFVIYMFAIPIFVFILVPSAAKLSKYIRRKNSKRVDYISNLGHKVTMSMIQIFYPSICAKVFSVFDCVKVEGEEYLRLKSDYNIRCWSNLDNHVYYVGWAFLFLFIYVLAFPIGLFYLLYTNRKHLYKDGEKKKLEYMASFYDQYEEEFYYFECLVIIRKLLLTGLVTLIAPGTPLQVAIALFICVSYCCVVLKTAPFEEDSDDVISFITEVQLSVTMFIGFALLTDTNKSAPQFDPHITDICLVVINCAGFACLVFSHCRHMPGHAKRAVTFVRVRSERRRSISLGKKSLRDVAAMAAIAAAEKVVAADYENNEGNGEDNANDDDDNQSNNNDTKVVPIQSSARSTSNEGNEQEVQESRIEIVSPKIDSSRDFTIPKKTLL